MITAAFESGLTKHACSYSDIKKWIEQEKYETNFWLFIEQNCGPIPAGLSN